jgi:hypothetical protein
MPIPTLTPEEYEHCVRACAVLLLPQRQPPYFRELLAEFAERSRPHLAEKIRGLSDADLGDLYASVRQWQGDQS